MAISICVWIVSVMAGVLTVCGPASGYNKDSGPVNPMFPVAVFVFFASIVSGFGCLVWLIVVLIKNNSRE